MNSKFKTGSRVRIKTENPNGTHRTPDYIKGKTGIIAMSHGTLTGYEFDHREDWGPLYTVVFKTEEIAKVKGNDRVLVDVHEDWLELLT